MNAYRPSEPRYTIVISKNGKELGTLRDRETIQVRSSFGGAVAREALGLAEDLWNTRANRCCYPATSASMALN